MTEIVPPPASPPYGDPLADPGETWRWTRALAIVLGVHALPALVTVYWLGPDISTPAVEPAVLIDMSPPAAPPEPPSEQPPGPKQGKVETPRLKVERRIETPVTNPEVAIRTPPPEPPKPVVENTAPLVRPLPPAPRLSSGQPTWQGLVLGRLNQFKRYPGAAQSRRQQGVPWIRFVMDRDGKVLSSRLERSSGFRVLDDEAVGLPRRAQPLPKPPDDVTGQTIELVVPVEFFLRD